MSGASDSFDQRAESTLVSIAVLIIPQFLRRAGSGSRHLPHAPRKRRAVHPHILQWIFRRTRRADGCSITFHDKFHAISLFQPEPIANLQRYRNLALTADCAKSVSSLLLLFTVRISQFMCGAEQRRSPLREGAHKRSHSPCVRPGYARCEFRTAFLDGVKVSHNRHGHESVYLSSWTIVRKKLRG